MIQLELDLNQFEPDAHKHLVERLEKSGYLFFTLSKADNSQATRRKLYSLVKQGVEDAPQHDGRFESFEVFSERLFETYYWAWRDSCFLVKKAGVWLGLSGFFTKEDGTTQFGLTVVTKEARRQGLARALKILALTEVKARGFVVVATLNHPDNHTMLRLNHALDFCPKG